MPGLIQPCLSPKSSGYGSPVPVATWGSHEALRTERFPESNRYISHDSGLLPNCGRRVSARRTVGLPGLSAVGVLLTGCTRSADDSSELTVHPSEMVPFEDLFVPHDTLVLDPSVIVGRIWFMDVDAAGSMLLTDMASNLVYLFASTGRHQVTYRMDTCLPVDGEHSVWTSRFADGDRVLLSTMEGAMVVFDRSGNCLAAQQLVSRIQILLRAWRFHIHVSRATRRG